jgi:hypothetical protein
MELVEAFVKAYQPFDRLRVTASRGHLQQL